MFFGSSRIVYMCIHRLKGATFLQFSNTHEHKFLFRSEAEDFYKGLRHCAIADLIMEDPLAFKSIFVPGNNQPLKGSTVLSMFIPVFSEDGSNQRGKEDTLMELWATYLSDMDRGKISLSISFTMMFPSLTTTRRP